MHGESLVSGKVPHLAEDDAHHDLCQFFLCAWESPLLTQQPQRIALPQASILYYAACALLYCYRRRPQTSTSTSLVPANLQLHRENIRTGLVWTAPGVDRQGASSVLSAPERWRRGRGPGGEPWTNGANVLRPGHNPGSRTSPKAMHEPRLRLVQNG